MKLFAVKPHESFGPVRLGATREEVRKLLGPPISIQEPHERWGIDFPAKDYYFDNAFQIHYDANAAAEYIEAASHKSFVATFDGISVHASPAESVLEAIRKHAVPDEDDAEYPCNQTFPTLNLTIYREHSEDDPIDAIGIGRAGYIRLEG